MTAGELEGIKKRVLAVLQADAPFKETPGIAIRDVLALIVEVEWLRAQREKANTV